MEFSVHASEDVDPQSVASDLLLSLKTQKKPSAFLLFSSISQEYPEKVIQALREAFPDTPLAGCSSNAEYSSPLGFAEDSTVLVAFSGDDVQAKSGIIDAKDKASFFERCVQVLHTEKKSFEKAPQICFVFAESLTGLDAVDVLRAFSTALPNTLIYGALSADDWKFKKTFQFSQKLAVSDSVSYLFLSSDSTPVHALESGWAPIGRTGIVTKATGNIVQAIDGKPALDFYREHLGEHSTPSGENPLAVFANSSFYLRAPLAYNEDKSIVFAGTVEEGKNVQITVASLNNILSASRSAVDKIRSQITSTPKGIFVISCAARKQVVGSQITSEMETVTNEFPGVPIAGMYAYGEMSPFTGTTEAFFHNETLVCIAFQ
jgi:hypothetical protein